MLVRNDLEHRLLEFLGELIDPAAREQVVVLAFASMEYGIETKRQTDLTLGKCLCMHAVN